MSAQFSPLTALFPLHDLPAPLSAPWFSNTPAHRCALSSAPIPLLPPVTFPAEHVQLAVELTKLYVDVILISMSHIHGVIAA